MPSLLRRQLKKLGLDEGSPPDLEQWRAFVARVRATYTDADQDRYTVERSLLTSSREMQDLYEELRRSEASFKSLVEASPDAVFVCEGLLIVYANRAMARMLAYDDPSDLIGKHSLEAFVHPEDRAALEDHRPRRMSGEVTGSIRVRWVRRDGGEVVVEGTHNDITFDDRPAVFTVARDITDRLRAEADRERAELLRRSSEERYRTLFEGSPLPILLFDRETLRILAVNETAVRLYGYSREEFLALTMRDLKPASDVLDLVERAHWAPDGMTNIGVKTHRKKDGTLMNVEVTSQAVTFDGRPARQATVADVTEKRRFEERLRQAQKMEAIGQLAGGIAHDFNNIIAVVLSYAELALETLSMGQPLYDDIKEIESAGMRAAALTRQLLTFSRKQPSQLQVLSLNDVVTAIEKMLRRIIGEDIELSTALAPHVGSIQADAGQIDQVLLNLVVNARDAMPAGGKVTVESSNVMLGATEALEMGVASGAYVMLAVTDTGVGMDEATRGRVFEPFFTMKEVGKGTGLGLATVFGIVKQSGGGIAVTSQPGRGATFRICFPRHGDSIAPAAPELVRTPVQTQAETILVVEDEEPVRRVVRRLLTSRGYTVLEARGAQAALDILDAHGGRIDLLLTDLVMPDIDGPTLVARVLAERPHMKILYMSGYSQHPALKGAQLGPLAHFIRKPFTAQELVLSVRRAIDGRTVSSPDSLVPLRIA